MAEPFLSEITMFGGSFSPRGWAFCDGQLLNINSHDALYSLIGLAYGGNGRETLGLPDLKGRTPVGKGQGIGLSNYSLGQRGGAEAVTLSPAEIPRHSHTVTVSTGDGPPNASDPNGNLLSDGQSRNSYSSTGSSPDFAAGDTGATGGNQSHNNIQPFLTVNYLIAIAGRFPSRN